MRSVKPQHDLGTGLDLREDGRGTSSNCIRAFVISWPRDHWPPACSLPAIQQGFRTLFLLAQAVDLTRPAIVTVKALTPSSPGSSDRPAHLA